MEQNIKDKIQLLINHLLSEDESKALIEEIKKSPDLKMEFALQVQTKRDTESKLKYKLKERAAIMHEQTVAAHSLQELRHACFSKTTAIDSEDLPIDQDTIDDFLEDDSEE